MTDIDEALPDEAIDTVLASIDRNDDGSSAPPACIEPDLTPHEWTELQREIASIIASMRSTDTAARPAA